MSETIYWCDTIFGTFVSYFYEILQEQKSCKSCDKSLISAWTYCGTLQTRNELKTCNVKYQVGWLPIMLEVCSTRGRHPCSEACVAACFVDVTHNIVLLSPSYASSSFSKLPDRHEPNTINNVIDVQYDICK